MCGFAYLRWNLAEDWRVHTFSQLRACFTMYILYVYQNYLAYTPEASTSKETVLMNLWWYKILKIQDPGRWNRALFIYYQSCHLIYVCVYDWKTSLNGICKHCITLHSQFTKFSKKQNISVYLLEKETTCLFVSVWLNAISEVFQRKMAARWSIFLNALTSTNLLLFEGGGGM